MRPASPIGSLAIFAARVTGFLGTSFTLIIVAHDQGRPVRRGSAGVRPGRGLAASHARRRTRATAAGAQSRRTAGAPVVAEWTSRATAWGGAAYHNRNVGIFTVRDGKIAAVREYTDTQHAAHVLFGQS
ncbi:MAG TPA: hypothetical protein VGD83_15200 [Streptosporangiaceae bacterium]